MINLDGKVAIIPGGATLIGRKVAHEFLRAGAGLPGIFTCPGVPSTRKRLPGAWYSYAPMPGMKPNSHVVMNLFPDMLLNCRSTKKLCILLTNR